MKIYNIYVKEIRLTGRFEAHLDALDGEMIVESSRQPLLDSARVLKARGKTGWLEMWGGDPPKLRMSVDIDEAARRTIREDRKEGPYFGAWKPFAVPSVAPKTAGKDSPEGL